MDYWINSFGEAKGPYTYRQLLSMWSCGALTADTFYYDAPNSVWKPLRLVLESDATSLLDKKSQLPPIPLYPTNHELKAILLQCSEERKPSCPPEEAILDVEGSSPLLTEGFFGPIAYLITPVGRIGRLEMLVMHLVYLAGLLIVMWLFGFIEQNPQYSGIVPFCVGIALLAWTWAELMLAAKRLHDHNYSAWMALLGLVPFLNIGFGLLLLCIPGTNGSNRYGVRKSWLFFWNY